MKKEIQNILSKDKLYDKKSLLFEEGIIKEIEDEFDSNDMIEGRLGEFKIKRVQTKQGILVHIPVTRINQNIENTEDVIDNEEIFQIRTETRFLILKKVTRLDGFTEVENCEKDERVYFSENNEEKWKEYIGFIDSELYGDMLGSICILFSKEYVYILKYAGIGNFTDIKMEKNNIMKFLYRRLV